MGISENESLYEMTSVVVKMVGLQAVRLFKRRFMEPFGKTSVKRKVGSYLVSDQVYPAYSFYPFRVRFRYTKENENSRFKVDLQKIRPMIDEMFDFEKKIAEQMQTSFEKLIGSVHIFIFDQV